MLRVSSEPPAERSLALSLLSLDDRSTSAVIIATFDTAAADLYR